jgi:hypothetical protein
VRTIGFFKALQIKILCGFMNNSVRMRDVRLPKDFKLETRKENGGIAFKFRPPLEFPYDANELKEQYKKSSCWCKDPPLREPEFKDGAFALLMRALPEYLGRDGFFYYHCGDPDSRVHENDPELSAEHCEKERQLAISINFKLHSSSRFKIKERMPTIDSGILKTFVVVPGRTMRNVQGNLYDTDVTHAILTALLHDKDIRLGDCKMHIQVENPVFERVLAAGNLAPFTGEFYKQNMPALQEVAREVDKADRAIRRLQAPITSAWGRFKWECNRIREDIPDLPEPHGIRNIIDHISMEIEKILEPANVKLRPLRKHFPEEARKILKFAA